MIAEFREASNFKFITLWELPSAPYTNAHLCATLFQLICSLSCNSCWFVCFLFCWHYRMVTEVRGASNFRFITLWELYSAPCTNARLCAKCSISVSIFIVPNFTTPQLEHIIKYCGLGFHEEFSLRPTLRNPYAYSHDDGVYEYSHDDGDPQCQS